MVINRLIMKPIFYFYYHIFLCFFPSFLFKNSSGSILILKSGIPKLWIGNAFFGFENDLSPLFMLHVIPVINSFSKTWSSYPRNESTLNIIRMILFLWYLLIKIIHKIPRVYSVSIVIILLTIMFYLC